MNAYPLGRVVRLSSVVRNQSDVVADPTSLTVDITRPDGTVISKTWPTDGDVVQSSTGNFLIDIVANVRGAWRYRWSTASSFTTASEDVEFRVY